MHHQSTAINERLRDLEGRLDDGATVAELAAEDRRATGSDPDDADLPF